jgi:AcrR family transcriptional regulator
MNTKANTHPPLSRGEKAAERRQAILEAAKHEFISKGYEAARVDAIAQKANVAKGTVYLHFADKQALFEETIRSVMMPLIGKVREGLELPSSSVRATCQTALLTILQRLLSSEAGAVLRLLIAETIRFPELGEFYQSEVILPMLDKLKTLLKRAAEVGELRNPKIADFPQLLMAPILLTVVGQGAFRRVFSFDVAAMIQTHLDGIFCSREDGEDVA